MKMNKLLTLTALLAIFCLLYIPTCLADPVRIMALGDSITGSPGCWRALLWKDLMDSGYTNIDFVGTAPHQGCGFDFDGDHEGHGGYLATNVAYSNELVNWLTRTNPDIVLMHFGTNDVWSKKSTQQIKDAFTILVGQMRTNNADMIILVAQIIPVNPRPPVNQPCPECPQRTINLNEAIPDWAEKLSTPSSPIIVVNQSKNFDSLKYTDDGVHPNEAGNEIIAENWYGPLVDVLNGELVCPASKITPKIRINNGTWIQTDTASVAVGDNLILSPEAANGDDWDWNGPDEYRSETPEVILSNIQTYHSGTYTVNFTNDCGTTSTHDFTVSVQTGSAPTPTPWPNNPGGCDGSGPGGGCGWYN